MKFHHGQTIDFKTWESANMKREDNLELFNKSRDIPMYAFYNEFIVLVIVIA